MAQRISQAWPAIPEREGGHFLKATEAEFLQGVGTVYNTAAHWKLLPFARYVAGWSGDIYRTKTFGRDDVHRIPLHPYPRDTVSYVALVIHYQCGIQMESVSDAAALANGFSIGADLYTYAGASLDGNGAPFACEWDYTAGTLPAEHIPVNRVNIFGGGYVRTAEYPTLAVTTGMQVIASPVNPTRPRPLIIPDTNGGAELLVRLTTVNVRIVAVDAWQMWQEILEDAP